MKISIALCTYNGEKYIRQQLQSILDQSVPVDEIVVSDDNSTDRTLEIAEEVLHQSNISYKIIQNIPAKGVAKNFLDALKLTKGDYCFTCDQDDIWCPDKVAQFLSYAKDNSMDLYYSDGILVDSAGRPLGSKLWEAYDIHYEELSENLLVHTLLRKPVVTGAAMMVSRKLIDRADIVPLGILHDEWFSMLAAVSKSAQAINQPTFLYRQHGGNVVGATPRGLGEKIRIWYNNLYDLQKIRASYQTRISAFYLAATGTEYQHTVKKAVEFWESFDSRSNSSKISRFISVTKLFFSHQYSLYYTGFRGYVRDVLEILLTDSHT